MVYEVIIDNINRQEWEHYATQFADYSLYQTWAYQQVRGETDKQKVSRIVIKDKKGTVLTMCQVRIKRVKLLGLRIGYVQWGPLIRHKDGEVKCSTEVLELLRQAYVGPRVDVLRVVPNVYADKMREYIVEMIQDGGFEHVRSVAPYRTMLFPLDISEQEMRAKLRRRWRQFLKKVEKKDIKIREEANADCFETLGKLYLSSIKRKRFRGLDPRVFIRTQQLLSSHEKTHVMLAYYEGEPVTAYSVSYLGDTAGQGIGACSENGLRCGASYLVWWRALLSARQAGMKYFDLGGIDPANNPGVYHFKKGLGGTEAFHIGAFEACNSSLVKGTWRLAEKLYTLVKK